MVARLSYVGAPLHNFLSSSCPHLFAHVVNSCWLAPIHAHSTQTSPKFWSVGPKIMKFVLPWSLFIGASWQKVSKNLKIKWDQVTVPKTGLSALWTHSPLRVKAIKKVSWFGAYTFGLRMLWILWKVAILRFVKVAMVYSFHRVIQALDNPKSSSRESWFKPLRNVGMLSWITSYARRAT
jgi:hypothetical protein